MAPTMKQTNTRTGPPMIGDREPTSISSGRFTSAPSNFNPQTPWAGTQPAHGLMTNPTLFGGVCFCALLGSPALVLIAVARNRSDSICGYPETALFRPHLFSGDEFSRSF